MLAGTSTKALMVGGRLGMLGGEWMEMLASAFLVGLKLGFR